MIRNLAAIIHLWNNLQLSFKERKKKYCIIIVITYFKLLGIYISKLYKKYLHIYFAELLCTQSL